jgi:hypothetical protein
MVPAGQRAWATVMPDASVQPLLVVEPGTALDVPEGVIPAGGGGEAKAGTVAAPSRADVATVATRTRRVVMRRLDMREVTMFPLLGLGRFPRRSERTQFLGPNM